MKKLSIMLLAILPLLFISCGNDDEPDNESKRCKLIIHNRINKSMVSQKSNGIIYDLHVVSQNGTISGRMGIDNGEDLGYYLPLGYDESKVLFLICKIGRSSAESVINNYYVPEETKGNIMFFRAKAGETTHIYITENTTYSDTGCSTLYDFKNLLQSILASIGQ